MPIERTAEQERAAIVAWLRDLAIDCPPTIDKFISGAAKSIERGDHHSGETNNG